MFAWRASGGSSKHRVDTRCYSHWTPSGSILARETTATIRITESLRYPTILNDGGRRKDTKIGSASRLNVAPRTCVIISLSSRLPILQKNHVPMAAYYFFQVTTVIRRFHQRPSKRMKTSSLPGQVNATLMQRFGYPKIILLLCCVANLPG